ncbi:MAG: rRNA (Guanine-N(2)-)-methyltransferase [Circular genetic element sp.]|nr:MAG: rRNA (Guanine-N(2)-)-methyltransferase [Circular genetic element sp.]
MNQYCKGNHFGSVVFDVGENASHSGRLLDFGCGSSVHSSTLRINAVVCTDGKVENDPESGVNTVWVDTDKSERCAESACTSDTPDTDFGTNTGYMLHMTTLADISSGIVWWFIIILIQVSEDSVHLFLLTEIEDIDKWIGR